MIPLRPAVALFLAALTAGPHRASSAPPSAPPWFRTRLVGMEVGPTGAQSGDSDPADVRYAARFDGREIVRRALAAHSEYLVIWARDGDYAYYNSALLPKAPGLGGRDALREAVDEARPHGLPVIAYCVVQQGGHFLKAHPEWEMRGADGKPLGRFCLNSGYLEAMKSILAEQLAYGVAGFHVDMLDQGFGAPYGCWCPACREQFQSQFGAPMPSRVAWDEEWERMMEFRYQSSAKFERALYAWVKSRNPDATVDFNYHGNPPFSWEVGQLPVRHAGNADFVTGETGTWAFSALTVGLNAEFYRAATPGRPAQVAMSRDARSYHHQTVRPLADLRWELLTLLAHGAFVTVVDKTAFDGSLDPLAYERVGQAFSDAISLRPDFGAPTVGDVGIYFSGRTRDWVAREKPQDYFQCFLGAHQALVYEHIPWDVILDENVDLPTLQRHPVVLLPNVAILSDAEVDLLRRYVEGGGNLITTGLTGTLDRRGGAPGRSPIETLTGARWKETLKSMDNWVRFPSGGPSETTSLAPEGRLDRPFLVQGPAAVFEAAGATPYGELMRPARTLRQMQGKEATADPMSADATAGAALWIHRLGKGTVLTLTVSPDAATAGEHHIPEARKLLAGAVRFLNPRPRVQIQAPVNVEAVVTDDTTARVLRIHFIAYNAPARTMPLRDRPRVLPALMEDSPIFRVSVAFRDPPRRVRTARRNTVLHRSGRSVDLLVENTHEVLSVGY